MQEIRDFLSKNNLPAGDLYDLPTSTKRFPDGAQYRLEIPSVEGPRALAAVIDEAKQRGIHIHRVSQGSGIMMLTDDDLREMARLGAEAQMEVSLFVGPRAGWDVSAQAMSSAGRNLAVIMGAVAIVAACVASSSRSGAAGAELV